MISANTPPIVLHADQEHTGLRTAVFVLLFVTLWLAYFAIRALLSAVGPDGLSDYAGVLSCAGAFPIALAVVWAAESLMKRYWPSGRLVTLTREGIEVKAEEGPLVSLATGNEAAPLGWYFELRGWQRGGRERRVPASWLCLAVELREGKEQAIIFTYMNKGRAQKWHSLSNDRLSFHQIFPREVYDTTIRSRLRGPRRPEIPSSVLMGPNGKYWLAERRRWEEGFELPPDEFEQFLNHIQSTLKI